MYVRELSSHLGALGVAVDVFTRRQSAAVSEVVEFAPNARVVHLEAGPPRPMDKYRVLDYLPAFAGNIESFRARSELAYDVVHSHYWLSAPVAQRLCRMWDLPLVSMFHTLGRIKNHVSTSAQERERSARILIEHVAMAEAQRLVAASPTDMQQMVSDYGADPGRIRVVPEGVDARRFHPMDRFLARSVAGLGEGPQVLFVGRIQRLKGIDLLLRAFAVLLAGWEREPKPHLTVVGGLRRSAGVDPDRKERHSLRRLAASLGIASQVEFRDAVAHDKLPTYYAAADVVVVPSTYESFGLVALEAMACGTPVIASRVGGLQWTVRDGATGFLVRQRDPEAFASAMGRLLRDEDLRARMSEEAAHVASAFSWEGVASRILAVYEELMPCHTGTLSPTAGVCGAR